jgi:hypothetical protein
MNFCTNYATDYQPVPCALCTKPVQMAEKLVADRLAKPIGAFWRMSMRHSYFSRRVEFLRVGKKDSFNLENIGYRKLISNIGQN